MAMFNWEDLQLPEFDEDLKQTQERIDALHKDLIKQKGISVVPEKGSPGLRPSPAQSREVAVMTALGLTPKEIGMVLNIEEKMIKFYYGKELNVSHKLANLMVARKALEMATSGRFPDMTKFWLKSQAKWKETSAVELTGKDGGPVEINSARDKLAQAMGVNLDDAAE